MITLNAPEMCICAYIHFCVGTITHKIKDLGLVFVNISEYFDIDRALCDHGQGYSGQ